MVLTIKRYKCLFLLLVVVAAAACSRTGLCGGLAKVKKKSS